MADESHERLREHPSSRFAAPPHRFDLETITGVLGHEAQAGEAGRRQQTLYKDGGTTVALFLFGHLTNLSPHRTEGTVVIHVLKRRLRAAGLPEHVFRCHSLRASTATNLLEQGVELADVQYLLGHSDPRTTKLCGTRKMSVTRNIVERISI